MPVIITGNNTPTAGGVTYGDGTTYASTTAGTSGQVLTSAGAGVPTWANAVSPAGSTGQVQYNNAGTFGAVSSGTSGQVLTSAGSSAAPTWSTPSAGALILLATLTPTAAANVDLLNTFTSSYDNYFIALDGISPSGLDRLYIRFATGGSVDSGTNYKDFPGAFNNTGSATNTQAWVTGNYFDSSSNGCNGYINVFNVNSSSQTKSATLFTVWGGGALGNSIFYTGTNTVSGFRLFWQLGSNFAAQGKVRVYGYSNT